MTTRKLTTTDAFVIVDLDDAPLAVGIVRSAPKVLVDGARWLARAQTYQFAMFGRRVSGASAGINAPAEAKAEAIAAFVAELGDESWSPVVLDAGRGVTASDLAGLREHDPRPDAWSDERAALVAAGIVAAADRAVGGLDGRSIAIEGFDAGGAALAGAFSSRGARIVSIGTSAGSCTDDAGIATDELAGLWTEHGAAFVNERGGQAQSADAVLHSDADVLVAGSKVGVIGDDAAGSVRARVIVPSGPLPVTAKALAVLRRAGVVVLPDFVTTAGHLAAWPEGDSLTDAGTLVGDAIAGVIDHQSGPLLGACEVAESFLAGWSTIPFGRPIA